MTTRADFIAVLAGGHGTRLADNNAGRIDKAAIMLDAKPLWQHALTRLGPQGHHLGVIAPERPQWLPAAMVHLADPVGADNKPQGPAGALVVALEHAQTIAPEGWLLTAPIDSPFLPQDLFQSLLRAANKHQASAAFAATPARAHPIFGLWHLSLTKQIYTLVHQKGLRALHRIGASVDAIEVTAWREDAVPPPFFNINTQDDLARAHTELPPLTPPPPKSDKAL